MTAARPSATRRPDQSRIRGTVDTLWLVNGQSTGVDPADRGLAYGDGLFETMAASDGRIRWLDLHLDRLEEGCRRLEIPAPSRSLVAREIEACCPRAGRAVVKLIVTRGPGARGYPPPDPPTPTRVLAVSQWPDYPDSFYRDGIVVRSCRLRLGENPALAGIKHLCRLEQVLAQLELRGQAVQQGLMLDAARTLRTRAVERDILPAELLGADEVFMTNALFGIWPVTELDGRRLVVGAATQRLMAHLGYGDA